MIDDITNRLAHRIWETFEKEGIQNDSEGNHRAASGIIVRILNGSYKLDEWRNFLSSGDYDTLKRTVESNERDDLARYEADMRGI
jgi:hypothetical protein